MDTLNPTTSRFYGWKTYGVAALAIIAGGFALWHGNAGDGLKGIIGGLALAAIRDALGKLHEAIYINHRTLRDVRAALDQHFGKE